VHFYDTLSQSYETPSTNIYDTPTASPNTASSYTASPYDTPSQQPYKMDDVFPNDKDIATLMGFLDDCDDNYSNDHIFDDFFV
jgi:hypothetical protein